MKILGACLFVLLTSLVRAESANLNSEIKLIPHLAEYEAEIKKGLNLSGRAVRELKQLEDGHWLYRFDVDTLPATIEERSIFDSADSTFKPYRYDYLLSGMLIKNRKQTLQFDYDSNQINETYKKQSWQVPFEPDLLDRLNYQLRLQMDIASGITDKTYRVIHKGQVREYRFRVTGKEKILTKLGELDAVLVEKVRDQEKKRTTTLWFGIESPFPLLKMIQTEEDGERYEINITKLN